MEMLQGYVVGGFDVEDVVEALGEVDGDDERQELLQAMAPAVEAVALPAAEVRKIEAVCPAATKVLETTQAACTLAFGTVTARRVLFVIDISGSMDCTCEFRGRSSTRLDLVKEDLRAVLKTIGDESYFGILAFDNNTKWVSRFGRATKDNVRQALLAVNSLEANGGTDIYSALSEAVGVHRREGLDAIYLLTDGEDGREDETVELVRGSSMPKVHTTAMLVGGFRSSLQAQMMAFAMFGGGGFNYCSLDSLTSTKSAMERVADITGGVFRNLESPM
jgi:Mg-chelatase subunit ChlD